MVVLCAENAQGEKISRVDERAAWQGLDYGGAVSFGCSSADNNADSRSRRSDFEDNGNRLIVAEPESVHDSYMQSL